DDREQRGPTYMKACESFRELHGLYHADELGDTNTVDTIAERFLAWVHEHRSPGTYRIRRDSLARVGQAIGRTQVRQLTPALVERELALLLPAANRDEPAGSEYASNTRRMFHDSLHAALNWAAGPGKLISRNPLKGMEAPHVESRGLEVLITPEQHRLALSLVDGWQRDFLVCLEAAGCRPGELMAAQAIHWRPEIASLVYPGAGRTRRNKHRHKTAYTGRDRVIYFTGDSRAVMERRVRQYPLGYLFRTQRSDRLQRTRIAELFEHL